MSPGPPAVAAGSLSPELKERVERLMLLARSAVRGNRMGVHRSARIGRGAEFAEHKAYAPGDEVRTLDWRILARSDRYVVKMHQADRALAAHLLVDASGSMDFGTTGDGSTAGPLRPRTKWEGAAAAAAAIAWLLLRQGDAVAVAAARPGVGLPLPARRGEGQLAAVCRDLADQPPSGEAGLVSAVRSLCERARDAALALLATDALDPDLAWLDALAALRARGVDVGLLHVVDPAEREFPYREPSRFEDLETAAQVRVTPRELSRAYREEFATFLSDVRARALRAGLSYQLLDTGEPLDVTLASFLAARERPGGVRSRPGAR